MAITKQQVIEALTAQVLEGNDPIYEDESARDHGYDWLVLSQDEFESVSRGARLERTLRKAKEPGTAELLEQYMFPGLINNLIIKYRNKGVDFGAVRNALKTSLSIETLVNNLAEVFRLSKQDVEKDLSEFGLSDLVQLYKMKSVSDKGDGAQGNTSSISLSTNPKALNPFEDLFSARFSPDAASAIPIDESLKGLLEKLFIEVPAKFSTDPFIKLYRDDVLPYFEGFMSDVAPVIERELRKLFGGGYPKYMVTTGIGANEQFTHFAASINNNNPSRRMKWLVINSPRDLSLLPDDADKENTLFLEFSRSSLTEETVKIHEYTPRDAKRIVFSNSGPLFEIAKRDGDLTLSLPDQVSGRYGRNKTPILLAPMFIAGMDVGQYWSDIDSAVKTFDISDGNSLPFVMAKFILIWQKLQAKNFIYFGCNDKVLSLLVDQLIQFWNEGVNKDGNDFLMSSFFGLPRDSHMNIEGVLGNRMTKMGIFLIRNNMRDKKRHPMVSEIIDPINPEHAGLHFGDEEVILAMANYKRFSEVMPAMIFEVPAEPSLRLSAVLGQLFADVTFVYSRLTGIDPGSNPEVKFVRERSAHLLADVAKSIREKGISIEKAFDE
ncbi:MAG: hypothetical protein FWH55_13590 [Oscillospiraceae bacterium]|nr:hypothetical protein [Oscillospiraceae bacterium]